MGNADRKDFRESRQTDEWIDALKGEQSKLDWPVDRSAEADMLIWLANRKEVKQARVYIPDLDESLFLQVLQCTRGRERSVVVENNPNLFGSMLFSREIDRIALLPKYPELVDNTKIDYVFARPGLAVIAMMPEVAEQIDAIDNPIITAQRHSRHGFNFVNNTRALCGLLGRSAEFAQEVENVAWARWGHVPIIDVKVFGEMRAEQGL